MRHLNKIILINSAQVKYAEINLDGNVHFIGTQGVGKSTLLRAILFFYNADTLGLGIPPQKKSYLDYYFNHSNSYIIYEVQREDGKFCVVSYKSQHKVCFRFFNGAYQQKYFVNENGNVPESWDGIAQQLDANRILYTKQKIDEYKEYRDIIYCNHIAVRHLEREKTGLAKELAWAVSENEIREPEFAERLKTQQEKEVVFNNKLTRAKELFDEKANKIRGDIRIQDENLKVAKRKNDEYERKNIHQITSKVEKKNDFEKEKSNLLNEKTLLSAQFADLEAKYKALLDNLDNQYNDFLNGKNSEKNKINAGFLSFKERMHKTFNKQMTDFREEHKKEIELSRTNWEDKKRIVNTLKLKKESIKHTRFFENDISSLGKEIQELENRMKQLPADKENLSKQIETIQKQWELDEQNLQKDFDRNKEKIEEQIAGLKKQIAEIESYINNSKDSLYGWLTENYPNWEKSIGKVIDDKNVLFNSSLNPRSTGVSGNFYGIEIDLNEINKTVKTITDYETEKEELNAQIQTFKKNSSELLEKLEDSKEKLKKKYQPKIREKKDAGRENEYHFEQAKKKHSETIIKLNQLKEKAQKERSIQLENIGIEIDKAEDTAKDAESEVGRLEEEQNKTIKAKEKERDKLIETEQNRINSLLIDVDVEIKSNQSETQKQKEETGNRKHKELSEKGADTKRLNEIDNNLQVLENELIFIENNQTIVIEYRKDKRDFMDKINEFKQEKQKLDKQLDLENLKYEKQKSDISKDLLDIQIIISDLDHKLKIIQEDINLFSEFKESDCFKSIAEYFGTINSEIKSEKRVKKLINEIKEIHYEKLNNRKDELRTTAIDFLGKFSENNIFKFKKQVAGESELLIFAEMLSDFVEDRKIEQIEKGVNERFAFIVSTIGRETGYLQEKSGEIQKIITSINNDFIERESIGAGVIKKIELRIEDSKNEIVQLLLMIKRYNDENAMELGAPNLFSSDNQEKKNKEAVDLLKQFVKKINEMRRESISLSDSFELKFRIEENQNDTGWQEKLTNVGSEGTDTLVKAMVNIMLLNVFKKNVSKRFKDFRLHCMMDEIGKLHPNNVRGILKFANERNILLINGSPIENDALAFKHIYKLHKDDNSITKVKRILTQSTEE